MANLKVTSKKYNDKDVLEVENFEAETQKIVDQAIEADKDIISQIKMTYSEGITDIIFPKGVMPLSITFNTHELFIKNGAFVDNRGEEVQGYELDDYSFDNGKANMQVLGDISEQVINALTYISFNGNYVEAIYNTYNLFFPQPSGTKLYQHQISFTSTQSGTGKFGLATPIYIVSTDSNPYSLDDTFNLYVGIDGIISMSDDNSILGAGINYYNAEITCYDAFGDGIVHSSIDNFEDSVTEL